MGHCKKCCKSEKLVVLDDLRGCRGKQGVTGPTGPTGQSGSTGPTGPTGTCECTGVQIVNTGFGLTGGPITEEGTLEVLIKPAKCLGFSGSGVDVASSTIYQPLPFATATGGSSAGHGTMGEVLVAEDGVYTFHASAWFSTNGTGIRGLAIEASTLQTATVTNVQPGVPGVGQITYTTTLATLGGDVEVYMPGQIATLSGITPPSLNVTAPINSPSSSFTSFVVTSGVTDPYVSGGTVTTSGIIAVEEKLALPSSPTHIELFVTLPLSAGTEITVKAMQNSGVPLTVNNNGYYRGYSFSGWRIG